jgi:hypothetical protein
MQLSNVRDRSIARQNIPPFHRPTMLANAGHVELIETLIEELIYCQMQVRIKVVVDTVLHDHPPCRARCTSVLKKFQGIWLVV